MSEIVQAATTYQSIPLDRIKTSPHQARKDFNEEAIKGLAASMQQQGLIEPIVVRLADGNFELISGERRLRAAKMLSWPSIEAKIIQTASEGEAAAKGLIENLQREDLNPIEEAEGFQELMTLEDGHWTQEQIGRICGKPQSRISESIRLLGLPDTVKENIRQRIISREHGVELLRLNNAKEQKRLADKVGKKGLSVRQVREIIDRKLGVSPQTPLPKGDSRRPGEASAVPDPFAELWSTLMSNPAIAPPESWTVSYDAEGWRQFKVRIPGIAPKADLKRWFLEMGKAMGDTSQEEAAAKQIDDITASMASATTAEEFAHRSSLGKARLPKTPEEQTELEQLAEASMESAYAWIYGADHPLTKIIKGESWQNAGFKDAKEGLAHLLTGLSS